MDACSIADRRKQITPARPLVSRTAITSWPKRRDSGFRTTTVPAREKHARRWRNCCGKLSVQREAAKSDSTDVASFTRSQRLKAQIIGWAGYFAITLISKTVRWRSEGDSNLEEIHKAG